MGDLQLLPLGDLHARANRLAGICRAAAERGDDAADAAAFEELLPILAEISAREDAVDPHQVGLIALR